MDEQEEIFDMNDAEKDDRPYKRIPNDLKVIKCPKCGEEMPSTVSTCVNCGCYLKEDEKPSYTPMSTDKIKNIRFIVGVVCIVAFIVLYVFVLKK